MGLKAMMSLQPRINIDQPAIIAPDMPKTFLDEKLGILRRAAEVAIG
jgi:hypothetical protein